MGKPLEPERSICYVACADEREILVLELSLDAMEASVLQAVSVPGANTASETSMPLALHPSNRLLYAAVRTVPFPVACFAIDPSSGQIQFRSSVRLADNTVFMQVDRSGQFLLAASYSGNTLSLYRLDSDGSVSFPPVARWPTQDHPHSIMFDAYNRSFYVPCLSGDVVLNYGFDADGGHVSPEPAFLIPLQIGAGPRHQAMHPDGCFLFVLNELAGSICVLDLRMRSAAATPVLQTVMLGAGDGTEQYAAADIRITPDGRFLYASERTSNALIGFAVDADSGSLTKIGIWDTEASPRSLAIDPAGCVLVAAGQKSNHVSIYRIDRATGRLIWLFRHRTHGNPSWVEIARFPVHR